MSKVIGVIAEDSSDVDVIRILLKKTSAKKFSTTHFVGKGCGPLKKKIPGWCKAFKQKGVYAVLVVHDLDRNDLAQLQQKLTDMLPDKLFTKSTVVIPIEELEAWLLSDEVAIKKALNLQSTPKSIHHPETIVSPKEHLGALIKQNSKGGLKQYVNTVHNSLIAQNISIVKLAKCASFKSFSDFAKNAIG